MNSVIDKIFKKCFDMEKNGLRPSVAVVGGENAKIIKEGMLFMAGAPDIITSVYKVNVSGNSLTIIETKDDFLEVYGNEKI